MLYFWQLWLYLEYERTDIKGRFQWTVWESHALTGKIQSHYIFVILQIILLDSHWLFRPVYGFIFTAAAVYIARVMSRKLHCDVMKTNYSWRHSNFFPVKFSNVVNVSLAWLSFQLSKCSIEMFSCPTLGLASALMLRPMSPELVFFPDFRVSNIPRYFCFCFFRFIHFE